MTKIIDVSSNNGVIDWQVVKNQNADIEGVMIKANEGYKCDDKQLSYNATNAHRVGLKVGYYHFATLNNNDVIADAIQEANYFADSLKNLPLPELPVALDIETNKLNLPAPKVVLFAKTFISTLQQRGFTNIALYSGLSYLNEHGFNEHDFSGIKIWVAEYTTNYIKPKGFNSIWKWQCTEKGHVAGIKTNVDISKDVA